MHTEKRIAVGALLVVVALSLFGACGGSDNGGTITRTSSAGSGASGDRPTTPARLQILAPAPNEQTGTAVTLKMALTGAQVVPPEQVTGPLRTDQGHIHVSVDGQLVSMNYGLEAPLTGLTPGPHSVQAEFVAIDHAPFKNRVIAAVLFQVQGT